MVDASVRAMLLGALPFSLVCLSLFLILACFFLPQARLSGPGWETIGTRGPVTYSMTPSLES